MKFPYPIQVNAAGARSRDQSPPAKFRRHPQQRAAYACSVLACLCSVGIASHAQPAAQAIPASTSKGEAAPATTAVPVLDPINGYAENLKPTKARNSAKATALSRPYEPIRKTDDDGQIPEIEMFVGESRVFPTPGVARIAVGNGALLTAAALDNKEVILFANGAGTSSLFIWNADGRYQRVKISIVPGDTSRNAREIAAFLSTIPKAKASIVGANIIVEGDGLSDVDLSKIEDLSKRYPQIVNFTNKVGWEQMVQMDVKVVEFPISFLRDVGLKWNPTGGVAIGGVWGPVRRGDDGPYQINIRAGTENAPPITGPGGGPLPIPSGLNVLSVLNLGLNAQLNLLEQQGRATTLAEPQLSARNGSKASFTAGGEIPYSVQTRDGLTVAFKEYGVKLDITPRVDHRGVIRATIRAEVSSIDGSVSTPSGPALLTRKTDTEFNLRSGETMVLAGLLQREVTSNIDKVPLLGDIPVLGALFRSKRYQNRETEMVVFVTPTVVTAGSAGNVDRIGRATERLQERMGPQPYLSDPLQPGVSYERPNAVAAQAVPPAGAAVPLVTPLLTEPATEPVPASAPTPTLIGAVPPAAPLRFAGEASATGSSALPNPALLERPLRGSTLSVLAAVTLRADPRPNAPALLQLDRGAVVQLGAAEVRRASGFAWRNVVVGALNGWVPANTVTPTLGQAAPAAGSLDATGQPVRRPLAEAPDRALSKPLTLDGPGPHPRLFKVARSGLALRITPDMNAETVFRPAAGDAAAALPYAPRGGWTAVQLGKGAAAARGWMESQWLIPVSP